VKKTAPTKKQASAAKKGKGKTPPPLRRGFTVLLAAAAANPPVDVDPPVASAKKGAEGKGKTLPLQRGFTKLLAAAEANPWPPAASAALPAPTAKKNGKGKAA
jgi:hypothetical protein